MKGRRGFEILGSGIGYLLIFWDLYDHMSVLLNGNPTFITYALIIGGLAGLIGVSLWVGFRFSTWKGAKHKDAIPQVEQSRYNVMMYKSRSEIKIEDLLDKVKDKYWSLAVTQIKASMSLAPSIVKMIEEGKSFRFLIINAQPDRPMSVPQPEYFKDSQGKIIHNFMNYEPKSTLQRFKADIVDKLVHKLTPSELVARFDVREYNLPITHTMIIIDPDTPNAKIHFEVFHYVPVEGKQPVFIIEKTEHPEVFEILLQSFKNAYDRATPIDWEKL